MKRELLIRAFSIFIFCLGLMPNTTFAQVQDNAIDDVGDIAFVAYSSTTISNIAGFAFVLLDNCPNNTTIGFTDDEWVSTAFDNSSIEGTATWTNNTGATIAKGTVIKIASAPSTNFSTNPITTNTGAFSCTSAFNMGTADQLFAFTGTRAAPGTFLAFIGNITSSSGLLMNFANTNGLGTGSGAGIVLSTKSKALTTTTRYTGSTVCNGTVVECNTQINTGTWTSYTAGSLTTITAFFADIPSFFTGSVLPIDLISFDAQTTEGGKTNLSWATASEKGNAYFAIEHATNGVDFREIAQVKGNGTTSQVSKYQYTHTTPAAGANYYRLRQVDADGNATYSAVRFVSVGIKGTASVFPTVGQNDITLITDNTDAAQNYEVYDMLGAIVMSGTVQGQKTLNISTLSRGMYVVKISGNTLKFIKD